MAERSQSGQLAAERAGEGSDMMAGNDEAGGLARGVVGSARTIAFGTSIVAPSASAATVLVLVVAYAGFASPLVVLITFAGSLCCALSIGQFAAAAVGRLGLHVQQPRPGSGRGFPDRLDDDLRVRPVRARRCRSDQRVRVATAGQHAARDHRSLGPVHRRPDRRGFRRLPRHHHLSLRRSAPRGRGNSGHRGAGHHHLGEDRPSPLLGGGALRHRRPTSGSPTSRTR